jgi:hypothetical protein
MENEILNIAKQIKDLLETQFDKEIYTVQINIEKPKHLVENIIIIKNTPYAFDKTIPLFSYKITTSNNEYK